MAELTTTKLDPDNHLLLDQPLLRLPNELLRKNLKTAQRHIEQTNKNVTKDVQAAVGQQPDQALASLEATLAKAQNLKRKLEQLHAEEQSLQRQQRLRIEHLQQLHEIPSLADVKYDTWSHTRLDRLLVDYLLRQGYTQSARELAAEKNINDLVDVDVFEDCGRIEKSLLDGRTQECLSWCSENKQALKKINSNLELELRLQQFIELARSGDVKNQVDAIVHARKHLAGGQDTEFGLRAGGLLAHPPDTLVEPYRMMYSPERYIHLARQFVKTHHELFSLPSQPLLHIALSAGLSALKTPSCHSEYALQANANTGAPVCPICSTELNELARNVPYAHHTKSYMEDDPVVLPNGRVFGRERLKRLNEKLGTDPGKIKDPTDMETEWDERELKKVYIS
ncbi:hypothetical protein PRZ48_000452 [Zasmidium cellare]|uniref:Protein FYV10 n=1 Tax=Zasmidium cellare TaxID=395010 RepID=A0ABR0EYI0_ZASCE|nr:hypothetical protein PRZ48_000452 [Zasmidium cellare]